MVDEPVDSVAPWTIKAVSTATRNRAITAARKEGLTVGQWLERRIKEWESDGSPVAVSTPPPALTPDQLTAYMTAVAALQQSTAALKTATGRASGRGTLRLALASLEQRIAEAEGDRARKESGPLLPQTFEAPAGRAGVVDSMTRITMA